MIKHIFATAALICLALGPWIVRTPADEAERVYDNYGVTVTQSEVDVKEMHDLCLLHQPAEIKDPQGRVTGLTNLDWWPSPCSVVTQRFHDSGIEEKYNQMEKNKSAEQLGVLKKAMSAWSN